MSLPVAKTACAVLAGAGCVAGGTAIYYKRLPATWREFFVKEGRFLLKEDGHWKAIYHDQKEGSHWTGDDTLRTKTTADEAKNALRDWCKEKLDEKIEAWSGEEFDSKRSKYANLCTADGIVSVKGKLVQSGQDTWIGENDNDKYKTIFAVYRYSDEFLKWMNDNRASEDAELNSESKIEDSYTKLKNLCGATLKKPYVTVEKTTPKILQYAHWWCTPLPYSTIKEKIRKDPQKVNWTERTQEDQNWKKVLKMWKETEQVQKWVRKANGKEEGNDEEITEDELKKLCVNEQVTKNLSEEDSYQEKYVVIRDVCDSTLDVSKIPEDDAGN